MNYQAAIAALLIIGVLSLIIHRRNKRKSSTGNPGSGSGGSVTGGNSSTQPKRERER